MKLIMANSLINLRVVTSKEKKIDFPALFVDYRKNYFRVVVPSFDID